MSEPATDPGSSPTAQHVASDGVAQAAPAAAAVHPDGTSSVASQVAGVAAALVVVAFLAMGLQSGGFGVAWPSVRADLDRSLSAIGVVLGCSTAGFLVAALTNRRVLPRLGVARQVAGAAALVAVGLGLMAWSPAWAVLLVGSAVSGLGAGALEAALNTHLSVLGHTRLLNLVHGAFGVGATIGPLLVASLLAGGERWQVGFAALALVWAGVTVGLVVAREGWGVAHGGGRPASGPPPRGRARVVAAIAASFLAYTAAEMSVGYLSLPLLEDRGVDEVSASRWIAAYWGALTVGRLVLGSVGVRVPPGRLVAGSATVALAGTLVVWLGPGAVASLGLIVVGAGFAGIFPALVALVPLRVGDAAAAGSVGVGMAAASVGVAVGPAVVGRVAERFGEAAIGPALVVAAAVLLGVHLLATAIARATPPAESEGRPGAAPRTSREWPAVVAPEP